MTDVRAYGTLRIHVRAAGGQRERDEAREQQGDGRCRCHRFRLGSTERSSATLE